MTIQQAPTLTVPTRGTRTDDAAERSHTLSAVARQVPRGALVAALLVLTAVVGWLPSLLGTGHVAVLLHLPVIAAVVFLAYRTGRRDRRRRNAELAASRERERQAQARAVRADERTKIAREMHDVVSHKVTLIAMQANALECSNNPEAVRDATESIRQLSTRTLEELRSLLGVLRSSTDDDLPSPDLSQLGGLVRAADVPVRMRVDQLPDEIPDQVAAAAYRTVQEALTNVHKHAPGSTATIHVRYADDHLRVEVRNDKPAHTSATPLPSGGHGLAGMAERALLLDGTFQARSTDDGGFEVRANYPVAAG